MFYQKIKAFRQKHYLDNEMMQPLPEKEMLISILKPYEVIPPRSNQEQEEKAKQTLNEALRLMQRCSVTERMRETETVKMLGRFFYLPPLAYLWEVIRAKEYVKGCHELYDLMNLMAGKTDRQFFTLEVFTSTITVLATALER